jgi:hypothetical protein
MFTKPSGFGQANPPAFGKYFYRFIFLCIVNCVNASYLQLGSFKQSSQLLKSLNKNKILILSLDNLQLFAIYSKRLITNIAEPVLIIIIIMRPFI